MGYLVVSATVILLLWFIVLKIRNNTLLQRATDYEGYYLLVKKYEEAGKYYGVFQQGEQELVSELSANLFVRLQPPVRGYLQIARGQVRQFTV